MLRKTLTALAASALVAGALAGPAAASQKPTAAQAKAITRAVQRTTLGGANGLSKSWYTVDRIRISSLSPSWALAWQTATKQGEGKFQPAYFILIQPQGAKTWTVVSLGTALVGCGAAPNVVIKDLTGGGCPPGEGIKGS
jgi:predicted lipoprotein with Yx(FWY)xxD motif